jgi:hypothetical protein
MPRSPETLTMSVSLLESLMSPAYDSVEMVVVVVLTLGPAV